MFADRTEAGRLLASKLGDRAGRADALVLAISRGGLAVARPLAQSLRLPLDAFVVRKLIVPDHKLLSLGAVASGGIRVLDHAVIEDCGLEPHEIVAIELRERAEVRRLDAFYRDDREPLQLRGREVILVDDGIVSGGTMLAAVACVRSRAPDRITVAAPVAAARARDRLAHEADEVICLETPAAYHGAPQWYEDFRPVSAEAARELLTQFSEIT